MREIKFRTWNGEIMSAPWTFSGLFDDVTGGFIDIKGVSVWWQTMESDGGSLMQFTGLKDKNGVEIYEGDILCGSHEWKNREFTGPVAWQNYKFGLDGFYWSHYDDPSSPFSEGMKWWEIIGNIHDNPELLDA